jgi:winged helix DNA-binding protein
MTVDITGSRLHNQLLSQTKFTQPSQVVSWLGAVQSQDYAGAKWAVAQRTQGLSDADLDLAFARGEILRTHVMRPTWHFVTPEDIHWILALTAPRVHAWNGFMYRQMELDKAVLKKGNALFEKALRGGQQLTRTELASVFQKAGVDVTNGVRMGLFLMYAELEGLICSGARRGKQFTYTLLEERVQQVRALDRDEALAELTKRYFSTRGPATLQDFAWWSGLTVNDAKEGTEMVKPQFAKEEIDGKTYWMDSSVAPVKEISPAVHLLPNYDEYFIGFKDRSAIGNLVSPLHLEENSVALNAHVIVLDGQIVGGWKRTLKKNWVDVEFNLLVNLTKTQKQALAEAADKYGKFLGLTVVLTYKA